MSADGFGLAHQIEALDAAIGVLQSRGMAGPRRLATLKSIAKDLRGRRPAAAGEALAAFQRRLDDIAEKKTGTPGPGYEEGALIGLGQEFIGRWPTVRDALESMDAGRGNGHQQAAEQP